MDTLQKLVELAKRAAERKKPREMKTFERSGAEGPGPVERSLEKYTSEPEDLGEVDDPEDDDPAAGAVKFVNEHTSPEMKSRLMAAADKARDVYKYEIAPRVERFEKSDYADRVASAAPKRVAEAMLEPGAQDEARERLRLRAMTPEKRESERLDGRIKELERIRARKEEMDQEAKSEELRKKLERRGF